VVDLAVLGLWLDLMVLRVFSKLNDSVILKCWMKLLTSVQKKQNKNKVPKSLWWHHVNNLAA